MRQSLESRLAVAEMLRKSAELEKLEKERSAKTALLEQESMMEKVVQEARRLKQDAEENSKVFSVSSASKPFHFISVNMHVMHYKSLF
jgi:pyruvate dehydrogenase complex dehydrogenase (E1) component